MAIVPDLLQVKDLRKTFAAKRGLFSRNRRAVHAVDGVSFSLGTGETLGLVGESGSGKSTLGRLMLRLIDPTAGSVQLEGRELTTLSPAQVRAMRSDIQMVFQDPYGSLDPRKTIATTLAEPLKVHGTWTPESSARIRETMLRVGLNPDHAERYPHQFSGGQRQRIGIARALMLNPKVLVLDEPVSALDVSIQAQIINLLKALQRERGLSYVFIAHDLAVVRHVSDRVAVLYLGKIVELADRDTLYGNPAHPYTEALLSAVPHPDPDAAQARRPIIAIGEIGSATQLPSGCRFHPRCFRARALAGGAPGAVPEVCQREEPVLQARPAGGFVACHFPEPVRSLSPDSTEH
ncbi:ATP-binding cassette domain-containing protein [Achromobacter sp. GG226]|uniref:ABC transporter ATP-binding protein n=1 Tax=Verticiella alkaliphila TaxID=2779529 RepID=UPI001C0AC541|nr:oligopeptide/dipeptide ABC transporter ATP-binding protein [Verticiella sp. GG226]MBU4610254.1 ATP-binding cassette domain-containing protein [Verticiella sp. GG226]